MIKVKGFRIELGEVENAISGFDGIDEFVVVAKKMRNMAIGYIAIIPALKVTI